MSVIKKHKRNDYTSIDNAVLQNKHLSLKAKGLLATMLAFDDKWEFSVSELTKHCKDGIYSVRSGLEELERNGYLCWGGQDE